MFTVIDLPFPRSLPECQKRFPTDAACAAYLEAAKWREGFVCIHCGTAGDPFRFDARPGVLRCRKCRKDNRLTAGTVMEGTHTPLSVWFWAAYLVTSLSPGMSAVQFQRQLGLSRYETAFQILHKLRDRLESERGFSALHELTVEDWRAMNAALGLPVWSRPGPKPQPLAARFANYVDLNGPTPTHRPDLGPCHIWTGAVRQSDGYGTLTVDSKTEQAHRVAFKIAEGRWPEPCALHHCDNRLCVRRSHLFEGARQENTADMVAKGRGTARALSDEQAAAIVRRKAAGETQTAIAADLGVSPSLVSLTLRRRA